MIYTCDHYDIEELVPPEIYSLVVKRDQWKLWMLFDPLALITIDQLRKRYGIAYVNDWDMGGEDKCRGYRPANCTVGSPFSQHRRGAGFDLTFPSIDAYEIRGELRAMSPSDLKVAGLHHIRRIESEVTWLHVDTGNWLGPDIKFFIS